MRPSSVALISIEGTRSQAISVLAEEPDVVTVREQLLMDVAGKVVSHVDDHAHGRWGEPACGMSGVATGVGEDGPDAGADSGICAAAANLGRGLWFWRV